MDKVARERLAAAVLERTNADQAEVLVAGSDRALMRFTHESSNQNVAANETSISLRVIVGNRTGVARTNAVDDAALDALAAQARALAELALENPAQAPLPTPSRLPAAPAGAFDDATATAEPAARARLCADLFQAAEAAGCWSAGYVATTRSGVTVANASGTLASFDGTEAALNVKMTARDSTGYAEAYAPALHAIDAAALARSAVDKARGSAAPRRVEPGPWTVILEPAAFGELLCYLASHFSAQSFEEGSSFCSDGLGQRYFGDNVTIRDDYADPLNPSMPFDYEGAPTQRLTLVERGVARNVVTDSAYAAKLRLPNTGHALPAPNTYGPYPLHLTVDPGTRPLDELIATTERGLLITRFWYIRTVDQKQAIVTGMTRDGTFAIENGTLAGGVRNLRFNQSILEALRHCEFSRERRRTGGYAYALVCPAAKIDGFTFTSTTEF